MSPGEAYELGYRLEFYPKVKDIKPNNAVATLKFNDVEIKDFFSFDSINNYLDYCHKHYTDIRKNKWKKL